MHALLPAWEWAPSGPACLQFLGPLPDPYRRHAVCPAGVPGVKPVTIELTDFKTKEVVDTLEVDACLVATGRAPYTNGLALNSIGVQTDRRGFVPVNDKMQVRSVQH